MEQNAFRESRILQGKKKKLALEQKSKEKKCSQILNPLKCIRYFRKRVFLHSVSKFSLLFTTIHDAKSVSSNS